MFSYRAVLKRVLAIALKYKYLWFFGLFATFLDGIGQYNLAFGMMGKRFSGNLFVNFANMLTFGTGKTSILIDFGKAFSEDPVTAFSSLVFLFILLFLLAFFVWLIVVSQVGIVNDVSLVFKKDKEITLKEGIEAGIKNFWSVLGLNLTGKLFILFLTAFISLPFFLASINFTPMAALLYLLLFVIFLPVSLIISFIMKYSVCYVVIKGKNFVDSIKSAFELFTKNWLVSLEMALILLFTQSVACLFALVLLLILAVPYLFFANVVSLAFASIFPVLATFNIFLALGFLLATVFVVLAGSFITTFVTTAWTYTFMEIDSKKTTLSKIMRIFGAK